jgi:hypothetical protein
VFGRINLASPVKLVQKILTTMILITLCLLWVLSFSIGGAESADGRDVERYTITFAGDSLLRYQYLAFVYAIHFKNRNPPNFMN